MPVHPWKSNFTAGELTERLDARVDIAKFANGAHCITNFICQVHGGITRRPGTQWVAEVKGADAFQTDAFQTDAFGIAAGDTAVRLIPFSFSTTQAYMLEFGGFYVRFYENRAQIESAPTVPLEIATPYTAEELAALRWTQSADVLYLVHPNHPPMKLRRLTTTPTFDLTVMTFLPPPTIEAPQAYPITLTLAATSGTNVAVAASGDFFLASDTNRQILFEGGRAVITAVTSGIAATVWILDPFSTTVLASGEWTLDGSPNAYAAVANADPIFKITTITLDRDGWRGTDVGRYILIHNGVIQLTALTSPRIAQGQILVILDDTSLDQSYNFGITLSGTTGDITLTSANPLFVAGDVDRKVKAGGGVAIITGIVTDSIANGRVLSPFRDTALLASTWTIQGPPQAAAGGAWTLEDPSWSASRGYPSVVQFFEQRLWFAATDAQPDTLWASRTGDYENFAKGPTDSSAVEFTIAANQVNVIRWVKALRSLLIGTVGGEYSMAGGGTADAITPSNVSVKVEGGFGSDYFVDAVQVAHVVIYLQRGAQKLRELAFSFENDAFVSPDLSILSEHLLRLGVTELSYASMPLGLLWAVLPDGRLLSLTYERAEQVVAWAHHLTDGAFVSIGTIPAIDAATPDETWVIVQRTLGTTKHLYLEVFDTDLNTDAAVLYEGAPTATLSGLDHLEGKTVHAVIRTSIAQQDAFALDFIQTDLLSSEAAVVSGGQVTLSAAFGEFEVGLPFVSHMATLRPELALATGTIQGRRQKWNEVVIRFWCTFGDVLVNLEEIVWPPEAVFPYTGDWRGTEFGWTREMANRIEVSKLDSLPCTVLGVSGALQVDDG